MPVDRIAGEVIVLDWSVVAIVEDIVSIRSGVAITMARVLLSCFNHVVSVVLREANSATSTCDPS